MKRLTKTRLNKTTLLAVILTAGLVGCGSGNPVPADAVKICLEAGGTPAYYSNCCQTTFDCQTEPTN